MSQLPLTGAGPSAGGSYIAKVLSYSPAAYWVLNETAGGTAADQVNSPAQDGAYTGVSLANALGPDGVNSAPLFDGTNDYVNIYTATLAGAFNGAEHTLAIWCKVFNVGVWTDSAVRYCYRFYADAQNRSEIQRNATDNRFTYWHESNNVVKAASEDGLSTTSWFHAALTVSESADEVKAFFNGSQTGSTLDTLGAWAGALSAANTIIGAGSTVPGQAWYGWLAHAAVWNSALAPVTIADLATV